MFLKSLVIKDLQRTVRDIPFKQGLNLVLDYTSNKSTDSGNSVGKTTFLRSVDYCLGSDGESIFTDPENKTVDKVVHDYLHDSRVEFTLTLETTKGRQHIIRRLFGDKPIIDDQEFPANDLATFRQELGKILFNLQEGKPTMRQLIKKFIRIENHEISNTTKFLHPSNPMDVYEPIFLYLFGFREQGLLTRKNILIREKKRLTTQKTALREFSQETLKQMLIVLERDIKDLEDKKNRFQVTDSIMDEISHLEKLRNTISDLSISLSKLKIRLNLNRQTIAQLDESRVSFDPRIVKQLYDEAKAEMPSLQRKFEDVVAFHQSMVTNKINFVQKSIPEIESQISSTEQDIKKLSKEEASTLSLLSEKGAFSDLQKLERDLNVMYENRGQKLALKKTLDDLSAQLATVNQELTDLNQSIGEFEASLEKRIGDFNLLFSSLSRKLYDEEYILAYEAGAGKQTESYKFSIKNIRGNSGSGKKKVQTTAFDLAYIEFLNQYRSNMPHFVLHDHLEEVHINQLKTLFEVANAINGQYFLAILRDRIENIEQNFIDSCEIVRLSEEEKFFRI